MVKNFLSTFVYEKRHLSNKGFKLAILSLQFFYLRSICIMWKDVGKNKKTVRI